MKLRSMTVSNFRCYQTPMYVTFDDLTALVGRNDAGKSSLLDALDIFFNEKGLDRNDASKGGDPKDLSITCVFADLPATLTLDETAPTSLADEFLLNARGELEITKKYNGALAKPELTEIKLRAMHPKREGVNDLLSVKIEGLKTRSEEFGVDTTSVNKAIKRELRAAIRNQAGDLAIGEVELRLFGPGVDEGSNAIKVWDGLKAALPMFALFKSDRQSSDQDAEAQEPLKAAIKEALTTKSTELQAVMNYVEQEVKKVADLTLEKLREMDPDVANSLNPKFERPNWATLIKASITGDDEVPLNKRGSGVRRLVLLNFFRAKAERAMLERKVASTIYAVEEPETSQHPHNQRMLMRALQQLAIGDDQVILTTHTPMLARALPSKDLRFIRKNDDGSRVITEGGVEAINQAIADSLGVLPDHTIKLFIMVEGIHDVTFLKALSRMYRRHGVEVPDLQALELSGEVVFVPSGGAENLAYWASRLSPLNRPEFHLFDRDAPSTAPPKHQKKIELVNQRKDCVAVSTARLEMENYIHYQAINISAQALGLQCALQAMYGPDDDVPRLLVTELNAHAPQHAKWNQNRVKGWLAEHVVASMDEQMVAQVDPGKEMLGWLNTMDGMLTPR